MIMTIKDKFNELIEIVKNLTDNFSIPGIVTEVLDILLVVLVIVFALKFFKFKLRDKKFFFILAFLFLCFIASYLLDFDILKSVIKYLAFWIVGLWLIVYNEEIRQSFIKTTQETTNSRAFSSEEEKQQVIDTLVKTAEYLAIRKTGALITIEGKDNLDNIINKSIEIESVVSQEILTTLFYVGTVTHDGAVIIRKNVIKCAGAYLPSTDRYDIPKELGTRHRAAIGISERCDAVTIIVSEETGGVSVTVNGGIERNVSNERLQEILEQYLIVK